MQEMNLKSTPKVKQIYKVYKRLDKISTQLKMQRKKVQICDNSRWVENIET